MNDHENKRTAKIHDYYAGAPDISYERVMLLADMAARDVVPDGAFSDNECVVWEDFSFLFRNRRCKAIVADF